MSWPVHLNQQIAQPPSGESPLSLDQARACSLSPSTSWEPPSDGTKRYLARQQLRAQTQLGLEAEIVRDPRGWIALWTRDVDADVDKLTYRRKTR